MLLAETKGWELCKGAWVATITGNGVWSWRRSAVTCQVFQAFGIPAILRPPLKYATSFITEIKTLFSSVLLPDFWLFVIYTRLKASCWQHLHKFLPPHFSELFCITSTSDKCAISRGFFFGLVSKRGFWEGVANFCVRFLVLACWAAVKKVVAK